MSVDHLLPIILYTIYISWMILLISIKNTNYILIHSVIQLYVLQRKKNYIKKDKMYSCVLKNLVIPF